jgi:hypothetical protein
MRTRKTRTWLLRMLALTLLHIGTNAWAQGSGGVAPGEPPAEPQVAQPPDGSVNWKGVGIGAGTVVGNLVYVPAKLVYGILGGIAGGAGYALTGGNKQVANSIWRSSLGGDYVLTPDMMTGKKPIYFSGQSEVGPMQPTRGSNFSPSNGPSGTSGSSWSTAGAQAGTGATSSPAANGANSAGATSGSQPPPYTGVNNGNGYRGYSHRPALNESTLPDSSIE